MVTVIFAEVGLQHRGAAAVEARVRGHVLRRAIAAFHVNNRVNQLCEQVRVHNEALKTLVVWPRGSSAFQIWCKAFLECGGRGGIRTPGLPIANEEKSNIRCGTTIT